MGASLARAVWLCETATFSVLTEPSTEFGVERSWKHAAKSAGIQHARQSSLLSARDRQFVNILHFDPHLRVCAVVARCRPVSKVSRGGGKGVLLSGGFQSSGPASPFDSLTLSVTAISCGLVRSLA